MRRAVRVVLGLFAAVTLASAMDPRVTRVGEEAIVRVETPHPVPLVEANAEAWQDVFTWSKASYIAVHFERFDLAPGEKVVVHTPDGRYSYTFEGQGKPLSGGTFWATHVPGDTCVVTYYGNGTKAGFGYAVDMFAHGYPAPPQIEPEATGSIEAICGVDDSNWAKCYQVSEPAIYDASRAVVRLLFNGSGFCTGWLVGCDGHVMTNEHCIATQADATNTDYEFMAEGATCGTNCGVSPFCPGVVEALSGTLVKVDAPRDYSLILLPTNLTSTYGFFRLRDTGAVVNERIYIPGHPVGWGKRIAVTSTDPSDASGKCEVLSLTEPACATGGPQDVGYMCDTQGGSSGSPVVAYSDHKIVALHHCANCPNRGVPIQSVIAHLQSTNDLPRCSLQQLAGTVDFDDTAYSCTQTTSIRVKDDSIVGAGSQNVTILSVTEPTPETVTLTETPAGSGTFLGTFPLTTNPPVSGNGLLSVSHGETITVRYTDADDGAGGINVLRTDTAVIDCVTPVISNVQATSITGQGATITWNTNENATSIVHYGTSTPPSSTALNNALVTSHVQAVTGLLECTPYFYSVESLDDADNAATDNNGGSYYTFTTLRQTQPSYPSTDTPRNIPDFDPAGTTSTINVTDSKTVTDVNVEVDVQHPYDGDLVLTLITPTGTNIVLSNRRGGDGDDFTNTVFDDEATTPISAGVAPFIGFFRPESFLSAADGINSAGAWRLKAVDAAAFDTGSLLGWTLTLTFPPAPCGPHAIYSSHSLVQDTCTAGGAGNLNGIWESGEGVRFLLLIKNDGTVPLTGVTATVTPTTPGVVMLDGTASYGNIAAGSTGTSLAPHFLVRLPEGLSCGSSVSFDLSVSTNQGSWTTSFSQVIGQPLTGGGSVLNESFSAGIPGTWTVINGGSGGAAATWTAANPGSRVFTAPIVNPVAIVDSDWDGTGAIQDEQLITPVLNLSTATSVTLDFDQFFRWYSGGLDEKGDVDVRSSLTGGVWVNVYRNQGASSANPDHRTLNITAQAAGASNVEIRFHYYDASYEFYWQVDNVIVSYTAPSGCNHTSCPAAPPNPPPVPDGLLGSPMTAARVNPSGSIISLNWDTATCIAPGYHILQGPLSGVSSYTIGGGVCAIGTSGSHVWTGVPSGNLWFAVVADNGASLEGTWGLDSSGGHMGGTASSGVCGISTRNNGGTCP